jgi:molybdopterin-guanine dinucleotide biosynthesis protein A
MNCNPEIEAVIMAGGESSRFGQMKQATPKGLLPISPAKTLVEGLLTHISKAGIHSATLCAFTANHESFCRFVEQHPLSLPVEVHACEDTRPGPIPALANTQLRIASESYLCILSDSYFDNEDPISALASQSFAADFDATILSGRLNECNLGAPSGYVSCEHDIVKSIFYAVTPDRQQSIARGKLARRPFGRSKTSCTSRRKCPLHAGMPFESWLQSAINAGVRCRNTHIGSFANINTPTEFHLLAQLGL